MSDVIDTQALFREPLHTIIEHTLTLAHAVLSLTGKRGITRISVTPDLGLAIGATPGTSVDIMTAAGRVEIYVEATQRASGTAHSGKP